MNPPATSMKYRPYSVAGLCNSTTITYGAPEMNEKKMVDENAGYSASTTNRGDANNCAKPRSMPAADSMRSSGRCDSRNRITTAPTTTIPAMQTSTNIARQFARSTITPPIAGATIGATTITIVSRAITPAARLGP